jgi:hypothetical protein
VADTLDPKHIDKRTAERYLRSGQLDEKTYEKHVKGLPDLAEKAVPVETTMADADEEMDDEEDDDEEDDDAEEDDGAA